MQHLRFLHYVDAVARCGSIRGAAETLHVAASAVNRRIQDLEDELGTPLFERLTRGVRLTAAGELFLGYARRRHADLEQVRSQIEDLRGVRRGRVALVASQALAPDFLPRAILEFQASHPGVAFEVKVFDRERAVQAVADFEADLGLVFNPPDLRGLRVLAQAKQRTCAVVAPDHPLAGRASVRLKDCLQYPLALPDSSLSGRGVLDDLFANSSARPQPPLVSNSYELMRSFAREAGGISFQIEIGAGAAGGAIAIPIDERNLPAGQLVLVALRERVLPVAAASFAEFVGEKLAAANQNGA
ncbi:LysR family transcriptional regulator [Pseudomonas aeruginosa]|jgi:DNA-binding transcriptional LysR family regulator|uniref:LysR family transcriptional regulator n=1 Tax=Pseudomonadota TaxID=1224 RepID=UPI00064090F4|nr:MULTISPECIES: LysR substrate-binding domain-containing protein [Pseudomonadota]MBU9510545.1 LysR family transcriptional regulator [Burkholderia multivorans]MDA3371382.1 LysR family transcriptional regulator [Pseudomonas aeruginosa]MDH0728751.1 LysR substrate-binding domain-containing protein [Stutzerimonas stutzeri]MDH0728759.1 LysR substrate-binding domain-containing protein [Stutzerimonas stutzeri]MDH0728767.1 LysR substrate-binding domain-containing protein [Stutzerimonas stutzeri]|tara:strand:+ start:6002 stop:6904 length:903 start_codon:yes stop_codon:yes gene_type:complete